MNKVNSFIFFFFVQLAIRYISAQNTLPECVNAEIFQMTDYFGCKCYNNYYYDTETTCSKDKESNNDICKDFEEYNKTNNICQCVANYVKENGRCIHNNCRNINCGKGICVYDKVDGFKCACELGFKYDKLNKKCVELNENEKIESCSLNCDEKENLTCENKDNKYLCVCKNNYIMESDRKCVKKLCGASEIDCENGVCVNEGGKDVCKCNPNYILHNKKCVKEEDNSKCLAINKDCTNGYCIMENDKETCVCKEGFQFYPNVGVCGLLNDKCLAKDIDCRNGKCDESDLNNLKCLCNENYTYDEEKKKCSYSIFNILNMSLIFLISIIYNTI